MVQDMNLRVNALLSVEREVLSVHMRKYIRPVPNTEEASVSLQTQVAENIAYELKKNSGKPALVLLSGGSAVTIYDYLAQLLRDSNSDGSQWVWGMVDERFDKQNNNYLEIKTKHPDFIRAITEKGGIFIDTSPHLKSQYEMADWYENTIRECVTKVKNGSGKIIAVLGMGPDGHTAGIMPFPEDPAAFDSLFVQTDRFVVGYDATGKNPFPLRFTATYPLLSLINIVIGYITGESKKTKLKDALEGKLPLSVLPAGIFNTFTDHFVLATDLEV